MNNTNLLAIMDDVTSGLVGMVESFKDRDEDSAEIHLSASEWIAVLCVANAVRDLWRELPDTIKDKSFDEGRYQGKTISGLYPHKFETDDNFIRAADFYKVAVNVAIWTGKVYREARDALDLYS
jgi:hypothetical protein